MTEKPDIRWKQLFQNYEKVIHFLEDAIHIKNPDITQKAGIIQFFELSLELACNLMKDYLEEHGFHGFKVSKRSY